MQGVYDLITNGSHFHDICLNDLKWPQDDSPFALLPSESYRIDLIAGRLNASQNSKSSKISLLKKFHKHQILNYNYLKPYSEGQCNEKSDNCLLCTSDSQCAWCSETQKCLNKNEIKICQNAKLNSEDCQNCTQHIYCGDCVSAFEDTQCEWLPDEARCTRKGNCNTF